MRRSKLRVTSLALGLVALLVIGTTCPAQGILTSSTDLPPDGDYVSPDEYHEYAALGIVLDDPIHRPILDRVDRDPDGDDELESFDSQFMATEIGQGYGPLTLTGPVQVRTTDRGLSTTGTFATEIISMDLSGGGMMVRLDSTRPTLGSTTITDLGGGLYHIDSFFDVFTELSPDNGANWFPSTGSTHLYLVPEPGTITLLLCGLASLICWRRRS